MRRVREANNRYQAECRSAALDRKGVKARQIEGIRKKRELNGEVWVDGFSVSSGEAQARREKAALGDDKG